jgi:hypothetical protein
MATDLPTSVPELQRRLATAREEYGKLLGQVRDFQRRAVRAEHLLLVVRAILGGDQVPAIDPHNPYHPDPDDPLVLLADQTADDAVESIYARRRLDLLRLVEGCWRGWAGGPAEASKNQDWLRVLSQVRGEVSNSEVPREPRVPEQ